MDENVSQEVQNAPVGDPNTSVSEGPVSVADKLPAQPKPIGSVASRRPDKTRARIIQIVSLLVLARLLVLLWRFLGDRSTPRAAGTGPGRGEVVPVEMATVTQQDVPIQIKAIGNVEPLSTVAVRSQVEGTLQRVAFVPGQEVRKGDLLFTVDPRPLQAALRIC